jgi:hypothetical protein
MQRKRIHGIRFSGWICKLNSGQHKQITPLKKIIRDDLQPITNNK